MEDHILCFLEVEIISQSKPNLEARKLVLLINRCSFMKHAVSQNLVYEIKNSVCRIIGFNNPIIDLIYASNN